MRTFCSSAQQCPCCGNNLYLGPIPSRLVGSKLEPHKSTVLQGQPKLLYTLLMVQGMNVSPNRKWGALMGHPQSAGLERGQCHGALGKFRSKLQYLSPVFFFFYFCFNFIFPIGTGKGTSVTVANSNSKVGDTGVSQSTIIRWWLLFFVWLNNIFSLNPTWPPLAESHKNKTKERENQPETDTQRGKSWFRG